MPKGIKNEHVLNMRHTYGASMNQHHFTYLIKNPNIHPSVREAFTREVKFRSAESGKAYSRNTLKSQTYYENDGNWVHLAENRDFWKKEVVEKVKFHYNYRYPEPIVEAQPEPPPELDFWDDWIRKKQSEPEPPPPPPPPPRETPKRHRRYRR